MVHWWVLVHMAVVEHGCVVPCHFPFEIDLARPQGTSTPTSAPSTGCPLLLSYGRASTELIFGFTLVTNSVRNRSDMQVDR